MTSRILSDVVASITELKANPMKVAASAHGKAIAVLKSQTAWLMICTE